MLPARTSLAGSVSKRALQNYLLTTKCLLGAGAAEAELSRRRSNDKKILSEPTGFHFLLDVTIARGNYTHVNSLSDIRTNPTNFALLQSAQKFDLKCRSGFGYLVEKNRSMVRFFPEPATIPLSPGKTNLCVSKQFRLNQLRRYCTAVNCDKGWSARLLRLCNDDATTSLPVPDSPVNSTDRFVPRHSAHLFHYRDESFAATQHPDVGLIRRDATR